MTREEEIPPGYTIRHDLRPGDVGEMIRLHGVVYAREQGFDATFEAYVAGPLAAFVCGGGEGGRLWIAERGGRMAGCVAVVRASAEAAQLRWFLVCPEDRGHGLGTRLLREAVGFSREQGYRSMFLWTVGALTAAARLYEAAGFRRVESRPGRMWGVDVVEARYERGL